MNNENFLKEIRNVLQLVFKNEQIAKQLFNDAVYPKYSELVHTELFNKDSMFLFISIDNYFNNESMKILRVAPSKQDLVAQYQDTAGQSLFEENTPVCYVPDSENNFYK